MNQQPIERQNLNPQGMLEVHSIFKTIQGEGPFVGRPAIFVRLAGCNLQCPLCDTDYTSDRRLVGPKGLIELVQAVAQDKATDLVVITGGEPFRQNLTPAVLEFLQNGYKVQVETNGTYYLPGFPYEQVTVICSPKAGKLPSALLLHKHAITAFKYVVQHEDIEEDGLPGCALLHSVFPHVVRPPEGFTGTVYVQPADEKDEAANALNLQAAIESAQRHGHTLGLQVHKIIGKE